MIVRPVDKFRAGISFGIVDSLFASLPLVPRRCCSDPGDGAVSKILVLPPPRVLGVDVMFHGLVHHLRAVADCATVAVAARRRVMAMMMPLEERQMSLSLGRGSRMNGCGDGGA